MMRDLRTKSVNPCQKCPGGVTRRRFLKQCGTWVTAAGAGLALGGGGGSWGLGRTRLAPHWTHLAASGSFSVPQAGQAIFSAGLSRFAPKT